MPDLENGRGIRRTTRREEDSQPNKGKPSERVGRKATGLSPELCGIRSQGCRANADLGPVTIANRLKGASP